MQLKRSWYRDNGQWLGPIEIKGKKLIGIDERYRFQSANMDEASLMKIKQLNEKDMGIYYCSVWIIDSNDQILVSKNETFKYELKIIQPQHQVDDHLQPNAQLFRAEKSTDNQSMIRNEINHTVIDGNSHTFDVDVIRSETWLFGNDFHNENGDEYEDDDEEDYLAKDLDEEEVEDFPLNCKFIFIIIIHY